MSEGKVALITGAAGGLGASVAALLRQRGYRLALTDLTAPPTAEANDLSFAGDLNDLSFVESAVPTAIAHFGRIDLLVNNAAWRELLTLRTITPTSFEKTLRVCLTAPAFLARAAAVDMERRGTGGVIVNVSSMMARQASGIAPAYVAAKGGLESLTHDISALFGRAGVRAVCVAPGAFEGPTGHDYGPGEEALRSFSQEMIPLGRWASIDEIARAVVWLAGEEASYITGVTLTIDGGWSHNFYSRSVARQVMPSEFK